MGTPCGATRATQESQANCHFLVMLHLVASTCVFLLGGMALVTLDAGEDCIGDFDLSGKALDIDSMLVNCISIKIKTAFNPQLTQN